MNYKRSFYNNILQLGSYTFFNSLISFLSSVVIARLLSPKEFGTVALITVFSGFISFFKDSGISYMVIRNTYSNEKLNELFSYTILAVGLTYSLLTFLLAYPISIFYDSTELLAPAMAISLTLFLESLSIVPMAHLRKMLRFKEIGFSNFLSLILSISAVIGFALMGFSYWAIILGQWVAAAVKFIYLRNKSNLEFSPLSFSKMKMIFFETKDMVLNISSTRLISYWSTNMDNLLVGRFLGAYSLGIYSRAYQIITLQLNLITGTFNSTLLPNIVALPRELMGDAYEEMVNAMMLITFPVMIVLVFFSRFFVTLLWGNAWLEVAELLPYFGVMTMLYLPVSTLGTMFIATHNEYLLFRFTLITSIMAIALIVIGILFSISTMVVSITVGYVVIIVPFSIYFGYTRLKLFSRKALLFGWLPKILISLTLLGTIFFSLLPLKIIMTVCLGTYLVVTLKKFFVRSFNLLVSSSQ